eukprot:jgi/Chlat1/2801/Chrsp187S02964
MEEEERVVGELLADVCGGGGDKAREAAERLAWLTGSSCPRRPAYIRHLHHLNGTARLVSALSSASQDDCFLDAVASCIANCSGPCAARPNSQTYRFDGDVLVTVRELSFVEGGLGWRVWYSALLLGQWLARHPSNIIGKRVLELGAGLGVCGFVAAAIGAKEVVFTDVVSSVLRNLEATCTQFKSTLQSSTMERDLLPEKKAMQSSDDIRPALRVSYLSWDREQSLLHEGCPREEATSTSNGHGHSDFDALADDEAFEVIIGSDLLYDDSHAASLPAVVKRRLSLSANASCYLVLAIRFNDLLTRFLANLSASGLAMVSITNHTPPTLDSNEEENDSSHNNNSSSSNVGSVFDVDTLLESPHNGLLVPGESYEGGIRFMHIAHAQGG